MKMSKGVRVIPWNVLGPGDDNVESINTLKVYYPYCTILHSNSIVIHEKISQKLKKAWHFQRRTSLH